MAGRKGMDMDVRRGVEELAGEEGRETIIRIAYMRKNIFSKRKKK